MTGAMIKVGMSTRAIRHRRTVGASAPVAAEIVTPWRFPLVMAGINVVLVVLCLVLGAALSAAVCAACAGYLAAVWRAALPERSNRGGGCLR